MKPLEVIILATMMILLVLVFNGCSPKPIVVKDIICVEQYKLNRLDEVQIRIHKNDIEIAQEYKSDIDNRFWFYENQVDRNNELCKEK